MSMALEFCESFGGALAKWETDEEWSQMTHVVRVSKRAQA